MNARNTPSVADGLLVLADISGYTSFLHAVTFLARIEIADAQVNAVDRAAEVELHVPTMPACKPHRMLTTRSHKPQRTRTGWCLTSPQVNGEGGVT